MSTEKQLIAIIKNVLNIENFDLIGESPLLGHIPEFDSQAVVGVMTAIEEHFGILFEDDEVTAELFATVGTLANFIEQKL